MTFDIEIDLLMNRDRLTSLLIIAFFLLLSFIIFIFAQNFEFATSLIVFDADSSQVVNSMSSRIEIAKDLMSVIVFALSNIFLVDEISAFFIFLFFVSTSVQFFEIARCVASISFSMMTVERFIFESFTMYSLALSARVFFVFFFSFMRILQIESQITCFLISHATHLLCSSMMIESHSLIRCSSAHVSQTIEIRHHFVMCSYL